MESISRQHNKQGLRVLIIGSVLQLFFGIIYVWSVFVLPVSTHLDWAVDSVKLTSSFMLCCFVLGILLGGKLQARVGTQRVILAGGLLMAAGLLAASFVPASAPWLLYIAYGVCGGFGVGMAYNANITSAQKWFPQKRGLATGVSVCAFGFSAVIFAPLVEALTNAYGIVATFRILAAVFAVAALLLFSFVKLPPAAATAGAAGGAAGPKQYTTSEILKTRAFYCIALSLMLGTAAYFLLNPSFKTLAAARGLSGRIGTALVMITGVANALGRLTMPVLSDRIGRNWAAMAILLLTAACSVLLVFAQGALFIAVVAVIAFCYGGYSGVYPLITADHFGLTHLGANYGAVMVGFAIAALCAPTLIGLIGSETARFIAVAVLALIGALLVWVLMAEKRTDKAR